MSDGEATSMDPESFPGQNAWSDEGYPALMAMAEDAARDGRTHFRQLSRTEILSIVGVAALVVVFVLGEDRAWTTDTGNRNLVRIALPLLLLVAFTAKITNRRQDFHSQWFEARAIAETIKSLTWRYIARSSPFSSGAPDVEIDHAFDRAIVTASESDPFTSNRIESSAASAMQVTTAMRQQRSRSLEARRHLYLQARVDDQIRWYTERSERSKTMSARWFWGGVVAQALLLAATMVAVSTLTLAVFIGFFATVSSATSALARVDRHDEARRRYALASQELLQLRKTIVEAQSEEELSAAVDATEHAIFREHGVWLARR